MRRHTLLALSLTAALALPIGLAGPALAVTDAQRTMLGNAASGNPATMQAAIATVLRDTAQDRPLAVALDELTVVLLDLGVTDEFKAEFANALVRAAQDLAAAGELPGMTAEMAGEAAAEAVLVRAQGSPSLIAAIIANASAAAATDMPGGQGNAVLAAFTAASTSPMIDVANQSAVRGAIAAVDTAAPATDGASSSSFSSAFAGAGAGPALGGMTLVGASTGGGAGRGGGGSERTGSGQVISPN